MSAADERLLREALRLAAGSVVGGGGPFGALVAHGELVVGRGRNRVTASHDPTAHAEIVALRDAAGRMRTHDLSGCVLYASCEPCPMCFAAALWARVERIVHAATREDAAAAGFDDARFHAALARPPAERGLACRCLPLEDRAAPFAAWLARPDRVPY